MKKAEIRGCGDILSQKLTFTKKSHTNSSDNHLEVLLHGAGELTATEPVEKMKEICAQLKAQREWLYQQPSDALIGLIAEVAKKWATDPNLLFLKDKGLMFVSSWCLMRNILSR